LTTRICKTCGKEYEACPHIRELNNPYRWQDVACSPECGAKYFAEVLRARGQFEEAAKFEPKEPKASEEVSLPRGNRDEAETADAPLKGRKKKS